MWIAHVDYKWWLEMIIKEIEKDWKCRLQMLNWILNFDTEMTFLGFHAVQSTWLF